MSTPNTPEIVEELRDYDIMQHIRNIYGIMGFQTLDGIVGNSTVAEAISQLRTTQKNYWVGTLEEYEEGRGNGTIPDDVLCIITNDYIPAPNE